MSGEPRAAGGAAVPPAAVPPADVGCAAVPPADVGSTDVSRADWDAFVQSADPGSYLQLSAWAQVKAVNGWSRRVVEAMSESAGEQIGAQVLVRRPRPMPWAFAYAPRGPVATTWRPESVAGLTGRLRDELKHDRVSHLRIDPEIEIDGQHDRDGRLREAFRASGWRPAAPIQPSSTRLIDLRADEESLWGDLRKKWRQYVNKARSRGITVVDGDASRLGDFYRIYRETAARAGFLIRTEQAYRDVWEAFAPLGLARLLFANDNGGVAQAALILIRCGRRVVEPYGGMTEAGAESRANYLLKWEAIRSSRQQGAETYDLWGLATGGIAHFKTGFGGREVRYIGAWDLVLDPLGRRAYESGQRARVWIARRRHGVTGGSNASAYAGDAG